MGWDQGPYPMLEDCLRRVMVDDAPRVIAEQEIECVYSLFQVYDEPLWAPPADGVDRGIWSVLRSLLDERARGRIDVPFVFHWGFDVHNLDAGVVRALDGQIFCNRELLTSWTAPLAESGSATSSPMNSDFGRSPSQNATTSQSSNSSSP